MITIFKYDLETIALYRRFRSYMLSSFSGDPNVLDYYWDIGGLYSRLMMCFYGTFDSYKLSIIKRFYIGTLLNKFINSGFIYRNYKSKRRSKVYSLR